MATCPTCNVELVDNKCPECDYEAPMDNVEENKPEGDEGNDDMLAE